MFESEIEVIGNLVLKDYLRDIMEMAPEKFLAQSGRDGDLVTHTKMAFSIGYGLLKEGSLFSKFDSEQTDAILAALLIHDLTKIKEEKDNPNHHIDISELMKECWVKNKDKYYDKYKSGGNKKDFEDYFSKEVLNRIYSLIKTHRYQFDTDANNEPVPITKTLGQKLVYLCNFISKFQVLSLNYDEIDKFLDS